jgi:hypothetical protein
MVEKFRAAGVEVQMSRWYTGGENGGEYDKGLTVIASEAHYSGADMFVSIHSNAGPTGADGKKPANYPSYWYRGETGNDYSEGSIDMSTTAWPYTFDIHHQKMEYHSSWSLNSPGLYADISFWNDYATNYFDGVAYKGYYADDNGEKLKGDDGKEKAPFDTSDGAYFFPGSKLAIDDFENALVGLLVNEFYTFTATFPDDYTDESFRGKKALFEVTVKGVYTPPIYNNAFIKTWFPDYSTTAEFEASLKKEFIMSKMYDYVLENAVIKEYPSYEYDLHKKSIEEASASFEQYYGYTFDEYIKKSYNMTRDEYIKSQMKTELVYYTLSKENNLIPTEAMLTNERANLISYYKTLYMQQQSLDENTALNTATEFVDNLGKEYIYENVMYNLVEEFLYKTATINEIPLTYESISRVIAKNEAVTQ